VSQLEKFLKRATGKGRRYWMQWIELCIENQSVHLTPEEIKEYTDRGETPPLGRMDVSKDWLADLSKELIPCAYDQGDGNIARARVMSLIVTLWTCRVIRAKCYNTRYVKKDRKQGLLGNYRAYFAALQECMLDESLDHLHFPHVGKWDSPFLPAE
jgi:hypothetical protein